MGKTAVVYKTKYGSTKKYAGWIAEAVDADLFESSKISPHELINYDVIVYGGALYAVNILGISLIKNSYPKIKDKKIIVFSVGLSPETQKALASVKNKNFTDEMQRNIHFFHLRGAIDYGKLNAPHRFMMRILKKAIERKKPQDRDEDSKNILESYGQKVDFVNKESIGPIVQCILS